jgi:adhesin transport system membrane fusion protein
MSRPGDNKQDPQKKRKGLLELSDIDLRKFDLTRKYDDDFNPASWRDHILLYSIVALLVIFILWASLTTLEEVARGDGRVIPSSQVQVVQNLEGGIIEEFMVREGEMVQVGQVILRMSNIQAQSDFAATNQKYLGLVAMTTRLKAEAEGRDSVDFPREVMEQAMESVRAEQDAFIARRKQIAGQLDILNQQLAQKRSEVAELNRRISDTSNVLALTQDERSMVAPMVERGAANKMELLQLDRQIASQRAELNSLKTALPRSNAGVKEVESRIGELTSSLRADAQRQLAEKTIELNTIKQTLGAYQDRSERTEIKSPVNGRVQDIKITTVGGVVKPGEPIMEIVPLEDTLVVEARIRPADVAFIYPGQRAIVRISAFDFSVYGAIDGKVRDISPDSITNDKGESFYRVTVETPDPKVKKGDKEYEIMVGMQATVDIITGEKTVMNYLLKPFIKASQTALRER